MVSLCSVEVYALVTHLLITHLGFAETRVKLDSPCTTFAQLSSRTDPCLQEAAKLAHPNGRKEMFPNLLFLAFFLFKEVLTILSVFPSVPRISGVRQAEAILAFLVVFLAVFQKGKEKKIRVREEVIDVETPCYRAQNDYTHIFIIWELVS